jgi:hypothetical protein
MHLLSRTRDQLLLGLWALAPVVAVVILFMTWPHGIDSGPSTLNGYDTGYSTPLTGGRALQLFGTIAFVLIGAGMVLGDVWRRPLPRGLRRVWTVVTVFGAPFGGAAYWLLYCHGDATDLPLRESS